MNRGLYIHFPFCEKKCAYCNFYSVCDTSKEEEYIKAIIREISAFKGRNITIDTLYFGGGTPSLMKGESVRGIIDAVKESFVLLKDSEITLELNPVSLKDENKLSDFKNAGINRLSIGVQSFNDRELLALSRGHSAKEAESTIERARLAGFDNISVDLMFGIPYQTVESFEETLLKALSLNVNHVSLYALSIEEKTVFGVKEKRGVDLGLPDEDTLCEMYFTACEILKKNGFEHYEISNFAKENFRSRHNEKYWKSLEYIGIGASAHSYFENTRYSFSDSVDRFLEGATKEDVYENTKKDRAEEFVFLSLRLSDGLDLNELEEKYGVHVTEDFQEKIKPLLELKLLNFSNNRVSLSEKGFFLSNSVIVQILEILNL
ncbi:MAG: radical SAM family heme chaperone HemW [Ruminococcaceae bacterium]|nr:radical SAM family heme chaperone HemW [Oscillospiraceae bacterium]